MPPINDGLLARVDFPLYTLQTLTSRHVLVGGGGGSSKTGVANGFEIFELSHDGKRFVAEEVMRYETGENVVMNCAVQTLDRKTYLVAGQENHSQLYNINLLMVDHEEMRRGSFKAENGMIKSRRRTVSENDNISKKDKNSNSTGKRISFEVRPSDSIQTDFGKDAVQRVVRLSHMGKYMATGGTDGHVRLWTFPNMILHNDIKAHTKEVDDLDFSPCDSMLISIAKDGLAQIWSTKNGQNVMNLDCKPPNGVKYLFKRCRFGVIENRKEGCRLFTLANPLGRSGKLKGMLQSWDIESKSKTANLKGTVTIDESLSALAVRDDGRFVAIGTMFTGSVSIYIAFSLQRVLHVNQAHSMFVTGLEFIPVKAQGPPVTSKSEAAILSISVDNKLCINSLPYRHSVPAWIAVVLIIFTLFCTFTLCSFLGI